MRSGASKSDGFLNISARRATSATHQFVIVDGKVGLGAVCMACCTSTTASPQNSPMCSCVKFRDKKNY